MSAARPDTDDSGVPYCSEQCPQHDGKRCRLMGVRPSSICEPRVVEMAKTIRLADEMRAAESTECAAEPRGAHAYSCNAWRLGKSFRPCNCGGTAADKRIVESRRTFDAARAALREEGK